MAKTRILCSTSSRIISVLFFFVGFSLCLQAQNRSKERIKENDSIPLFNGVYVFADLAGPLQMAFTDSGQAEGGVQVNLKGRFFPVFEAGYGMANSKNEETKTSFKTNSPYFRIGCDYNALKRKNTPYKLLIGLRYAVSPFKFSIENPSVTDPIWNTNQAISLENISQTYHWAEAVVGVNVKIYKMLHLGWTLRYKYKVASTGANNIVPHYAPGFGSGGTSNFGGTFNIIIAL